MSFLTRQMSGIASSWFLVFSLVNCYLYCCCRYSVLLYFSVVPYCHQTQYTIQYRALSSLNLSHILYNYIIACRNNTNDDRQQDVCALTLISAFSCSSFLLFSSRFLFILTRRNGDICCYFGGNGNGNEKKHVANSTDPKKKTWRNCICRLDW